MQVTRAALDRRARRLNGLGAAGLSLLAGCGAAALYRRGHRPPPGAAAVHVRVTRIALDSRARRLNWVWTGVLSLVFGWLAAAIYLPEQGGSHPSATARWWWIGVVGACWVANCVYMVNRGYGATELSADGLRMHSCFTRRFIAWTDITSVEPKSHKSHSGRGIPWWDITVHISSGQKRHLPGTFTFTSSKKSRRALKENLDIITSYWTRAVRPADVGDRRRPGRQN